MHVSGDSLTVFDLDSAGGTWRAVESQGVYQFAKQTEEPYWESWLAGYQSVRPMPVKEQQAVPYLVALYGFENLAWKLGLTKSSDGKHVQEEDVPHIVDDWITWATHELAATPPTL